MKVEDWLKLLMWVFTPVVGVGGYIWGRKQKHANLSKTSEESNELRIGNYQETSKMIEAKDALIAVLKEKINLLEQKDKQKDEMIKTLEIKISMLELQLAAKH